MHSFAGCPTKPCDDDDGGVVNGSWCLTASVGRPGEPSGDCIGEEWDYCQPRGVGWREKVRGGR